MSDCTHNCNTCNSKCSKEELLLRPKDTTRIKKIIGVVSGKGGVGKSLVTSILASHFHKLGYRVGILDADITGPSIPKSFGVKGQVEGMEEGILPKLSKEGIRMISVNNLLEDETKPVVWRGPVIAGVLQQFWTDVVWGDLDYLFVDMPPGTGDVALTVFQSLPIDGIIVVSTPQELVKMIVSKVVNMANLMGVEILGLFENMSYVKCPCCDEKIQLFGESKIHSIAKNYHLDVIGELPIDPEISAKVDRGEVYQVEINPFTPEFIDKIKV